MKQKLIIMVGLPGSGKTTKSLQIAEDNNFSYVSRDFVRNMTGLGFGKRELAISKNIYLGLIEAALLRGETVVADATHLKDGSRAPLIALGKQYGAEILSIVMNTSYETCILRNSERDELEMVPQAVLRDMNKALQFPVKQEGFSNVYSYNEGEDDKWD